MTIRKNLSSSGVKPNYYVTAELDKDPEALKKYEEYLKQHQAKLRQLQREARGEVAPEDWYNE